MDQDPYISIYIQTQQLINDFGMTRETYGALSGLPAIPNVVFGPLGGVVVDWMGAGAYGWRIDPPNCRSECVAC